MTYSDFSVFLQKYHFNSLLFSLILVYSYKNNCDFIYNFRNFNVYV